MSPHTHRLIFNPLRGCLMAVAESARSCGKGRQAAQGRRGKLRDTLQATRLINAVSSAGSTTLAAGKDLTLGMPKGSASFSFSNLES